MDSNNTSLIEEIVDLRIKARINQALIDTILDNTALDFRNKPEITVEGMRELYTLIKRFYEDEYTFCINETLRKYEDQEGE